MPTKDSSLKSNKTRKLASMQSIVIIFSCNNRDNHDFNSNSNCSSINNDKYRFNDNVNSCAVITVSRLVVIVITCSSIMVETETEETVKHTQ